tara:strand:- start:235 stop:447 length:213 start_codon:yes stop_codon:yes gene_type:complete
MDGYLNLLNLLKRYKYMYRVVFDDNVIICEDLDVATEVAAALMESDYKVVEIFPAMPTDLDSLEEVDVEC